MKKIIIKSVCAFLLLCSLNVTYLSSVRAQVNNSIDQELEKMIKSQKTIGELIKFVESKHTKGMDLTSSIEKIEIYHRLSLKKMNSKVDPWIKSYVKDPKLSPEQEEEAFYKKMRNFRNINPGYQAGGYEDSTYAIMDYTVYASLKDKVSPEMKDYLDIMIKETGQNITSSGKYLNITMPEAYERYLMTQEFLKKYPKSQSKQRKLIENLNKSYPNWELQPLIFRPIEPEEVAQLKKLVQKDTSPLSQDIKEFSEIFDKYHNEKSKDLPLGEMVIDKKTGKKISLFDYLENLVHKHATDASFQQDIDASLKKGSNLLWSFYQMD